jgi:TonB family protein
MKILLMILLLFQAEQAPNKWECYGDSQLLQNEQLTRVKPSELKERVVTCAVPHLPGAFDGQGTVIIEVQVDESGNIRCARVLGGASHPIMWRAALDAAKQWKFEPLKTDGKAKPFVSILALMVSWDTEKASEQCPKEKRRT